MPHPFLIDSQSDYLIWIVDINSHTEWQTVQIQISWLPCGSQLIWIYTVCKGRVYPGSAGQGLSFYIRMVKTLQYNTFKKRFYIATVYLDCVSTLSVGINSVDPHLVMLDVPSDQGPHCLPLIQELLAISTDRKMDVQSSSKVRS